jgi:hypothetical protein
VDYFINAASTLQYLVCGIDHTVGTGVDERTTMESDIFVPAGKRVRVGQRMESGLFVPAGNWMGVGQR